MAKQIFKKQKTYRIVAWLYIKIKTTRHLNDLLKQANVIQITVKCQMPGTPAFHCQSKRARHKDRDWRARGVSSELFSPDTNMARQCTVKKWWIHIRGSPFTLIVTRKSKMSEPGHPTWGFSAISMKLQCISIFTKSGQGLNIES